jgi:membrane protein required for colicin V production
MGDLPINIIDIAILAVLLLSAAMAFMRGCVHEVLSVGAWVGAGLATLYGFSSVQPHARDLIAIDLLADIVAGVALFVVVLIVLAVISRMLSNQVRDSSLGALDRSLGLVFGLARGALLVAVAWMLMTWALPDPDQRPHYIREAKSARLAQLGADALERVLPASLRGRADEAAATVKQGARDAQRLNKFIQPEAKADKPDPKQGYSQQERSGMDRLTDTVTSGSENGGE